MERKREGDREIGRQRATERQRDSETERQRERERDRERERETPFRITSLVFNISAVSRPVFKKKLETAEMLKMLKSLLPC